MQRRCAFIEERLMIEVELDVECIAKRKKYEEEHQDSCFVE